MKRKLDGGLGPKLIALGLLLGLTLCSGCYRVQYLASEHTVNEPHTLQADYFLAGSVGEARLDMTSLCPRTVSAVEVRQGWKQVLISIATLGIYTPLEVEVWCGPGPEDTEAAQ